jgi:hypothetical protein
MNENEIEEGEHESFKESITGIGQRIIGEIEKLAGVVNADPLAQAEGEFNIEVGEIRDDLEDSGIDENQQ